MRSEIEKILAVAYAEDIGSGDITSNSVIADNAVGEFAFRTRENIVFCGREVIEIAFPEANILARDGQHLEPGAVIATINGNVREILTKERSVLNLIQFLSAIATATGKFVEAVKGTKAKIYDTRKTIPGLRALSKYAVKCGGGENHRMGLYDMVLIKDNHITAAGGVAEAISAAREAGVKVEIECDTLAQVQAALAAKPDIILADNMNVDQLREVVKLAGGKVPIEASGNVNLQNIRGIAQTGVDFISTSKITISAGSVDISLDEFNR